MAIANGTSVVVGFATPGVRPPRRLSGSARADDAVHGKSGCPQPTPERAVNTAGFRPGNGSKRVPCTSVASASGDSARPVSGRRAAAKHRQPAPGPSPTLSRRELGRRLRELRTGLGLTVEQVGAQLLCSATKISRLETGSRQASLRDVRDLCHLYQVTDQARIDELMDLANQARQAEWWTRYEERARQGTRPLFSPFLGLEQEAAAITSYSMYYVPALLQTADYARAIIKGIERKIAPDVLDQRVEARLRRQQLLEQEVPPRYRALLDEAVLRRQVGGLAIMRAQLDHMLAAIQGEKVTLQVITFEVGAHASTDSNFDFLEFGEDSHQRPMVYVEGLFNPRLLERPVEVERYREALEYLRDCALSPRDSTNLITKIRSAYKA